MLLYTSLPYNVFGVLVSALSRSTLSYYRKWTPTSISLADQLLMTLMKLKMNCKDADLAFQFECSTATVGNIVITLVHALHNLLYDENMECTFPSQIQCEGTVPKVPDAVDGDRA